MENDLAQNLLPTLIQCFGTILIGFIFGQMHIIQSNSAKGLCIFLQFLSLPSLIFTSLATLSFNNVKWQFVAAILVAKTFVFLLVAFLTLILTQPANLGKAGIYAIAASQSNDLALGYPLMVSIYKNVHSEFPLILYFVIPIQLLLLNPIGFFMMETYKQLNDPIYRREHKLFTIIKEILKNPVIMATILGLTWNLSFNHREIPPVIYKLLEALGSVFSTVALFLLGHGMSIEGGGLRKQFSLSPALIVLAKILLLPLVLQKLTIYMMKGTNEYETQNFTSLGFLYGTIPTAPSVFVFAKHYDISVDVITSTTVYSTLFSAPLMLTSALMISFIQDGVTNFQYYLTQTSSYMGAVNLFCCILVFFLFMFRRQWHNICNIGTIYIIAAQAVSSTGAVLLFSYRGNDPVMFAAGYILQTVGLFATYIFATFLALVIFLLQWKSLCFMLRYKKRIQSLGFVIPLVTVTIVALSLLYAKDEESAYFEIGKAQHAATLTISLVTLITTSVLLICGHRYCRSVDICKQDVNIEISSDDYSDQLDESQGLITSKPACDSPNCCGLKDPEDLVSSDNCIGTLHKASASSVNRDDSHSASYSNLCCSARNCGIQQRIQCSQNVQNYQNELSNSGVQDLNSFEQYKRYMILLLSLSCCMIVSIGESFSKLLEDTKTGAFIELQFLNIVCRNGFGILCLFLFGIKSWHLCAFCKNSFSPITGQPSCA